MSFLSDDELIRGARAAHFKRLAVVVPQQAAESFSAIENALRASDFHSRFNQFVAESLMIAFVVIVSGVLLQRVSEPGFTEENHSVEGFGFQTQEEPL